MSNKTKRRYPKVGDFYRSSNGTLFFLVSCEFEEEDNTDMFRCKNMERDVPDMKIHLVTLRNHWEYVG